MSKRTRQMQDPAATAAAPEASAPIASVPRAPAADIAQPTPPRPRDKHTGTGGTYIIDPQTGKRVLQHRCKQGCPTCKVQVPTR